MSSPYKISFFNFLFFHFLRLPSFSLKIIFLPQYNLWKSISLIFNRDFLISGFSNFNFIFIDEFSEVSDENLKRLNVYCLMSRTSGDIRVKLTIKDIGARSRERGQASDSAEGKAGPKSILTKRGEKRDSTKKQVGISWTENEVREIASRDEPLNRANPLREIMVLRLSTLFTTDLKIRRETSALSRGKYFVSSIH